MALIPPDFLDTIVSFHAIEPIEDGSDVVQLHGVATGFLVGYPAAKDGDHNPLFRVFLVTNRHVYVDKSGEYVGQLLVRFNDDGDSAHFFKLNLLDEDGEPIWFGHDDSEVDVAVVPLPIGELKKKGASFAFFHSGALLFAKDFEKNNISTGDGLFVLGFPMGISGEKRNYAIVRQGIVARVDEELLEKGHFYIDANIYEGNSGGPVIHKPELISIDGTKANGTAGLMGMISSVTKFKADTNSQFEATGLALVVPVERICEVIEKIVGNRKTEDLPIVVQVGIATEIETALPIKATKEVHIGVAEETNKALPISPKIVTRKEPKQEDDPGSTGS